MFWEVFFQVERPISFEPRTMFEGQPNAPTTYQPRNPIKNTVTATIAASHSAPPGPDGRSSPR